MRGAGTAGRGTGNPAGAGVCGLPGALRLPWRLPGGFLRCLLPALLLVACGEPDSRTVDARLSVSSVLAGPDTAGYARATGPRPFRFPADHGPHPDYRTEWWYATGNLEGPEGRRFGYQFTVFRSALSPEPPDRRSAWATNQAYMAHFALTDAASGRFFTAERFSRGALGLAGARARPFRIWLEGWEMSGEGDGAFPLRLRAASESVSVDLVLERGKPPVLQGDDGLSPKGPEPGNASYYYSLTRMPTRGRVTVEGRSVEVRGLSWLDREWSTSALGPELAGWDWFALQLDGGAELMYYRLRGRDGSTVPESGGSWVAPDGASSRLGTGEVRLEPLAWWRSPEGGARYPVAWSVRIPDRGLDLRVRAVLPDQEWRGAFRYWEGAVDVTGTRDGTPVSGRGYVELTGYGDGFVPGAGAADPGG